ncbi:hypothetical protein PGSY75_0531000 [Plasmodium gaboni]|uniref:SURF1-like protein n=1 Tax=Plasmodium gaboni TaxID=647221 RepID=A0A151LTJ4_9APIC|nr:hypothetical protein PGSY75_0531000 [Plasmodium gaboni]KYO02504.1 hypothetical protein PGSY75_0531000 [Plasmodium gaboni]
MPLFKYDVNAKEIIFKLNNFNFSQTIHFCNIHIKCMPSTGINNYNINKSTYINRKFIVGDKNVRRTNRNIRLRKSKYKDMVILWNKEKGENKKKKINGKKLFVSGFKKSVILNKIHIDLLNEELRNVENEINKKYLSSNEEKEIILRDCKYPSQKFYKANEEEIKIIRKSEGQYYLPIECEDSTIIRIVNINDKVTSPISRCVRNSKFGLRKKERTFFFYYSTFICSFFFTMGVWQYKKMKKKKFLINYISNNLNDEIINLNLTYFPWVKDYKEMKNEYTKLCRNLLKCENKLVGGYNILRNIYVNVLSNYEYWIDYFNVIGKLKYYIETNDSVNARNYNEMGNENGMENLCVNKNDSISNNRKNLYDNIKRKGKEEYKNRIEYVTLDLNNIDNIYEWLVKIRNENILMKLYRKFLKKNEIITNDELKKLVIEKYKYRKVEITGVLDTTNEVYVGPKIYEKDSKQKYFYVICPLFLKNGNCILVNRGLISNDILEEKTNEIPKVVTIRAVLDPGELYECSFKKIKNISNQSNKKESYFYYYNIEEICNYTNISKFEGTSYFIANIYDIIFHEDYLSDIQKDYNNNMCEDNNSPGKTNYIDINNKNDINTVDINEVDRETQERIKRLTKGKKNEIQKDNNYVNNVDDEYLSDILYKRRPFRYDEHFIHKKKKDYVKFYADESTHFNYACQWFLFSFIFSTISIFKFVQFKRWVF